MTNGKKLESGFYGIKILDACVYLIRTELVDT